LRAERNPSNGGPQRPSLQQDASHFLPQISTLAPLDVENIVNNRQLTVEESAPIHYAFSPLGRLPTELLQNIFLYITKPSTLLLVCKYWQRVAEKLSPLWEMVVFDPAEQTARTAASLLRQLESGRYRTIRVDIVGWPRQVEHEALLKVVRYCLTNLQHTQQLSINLDIEGSTAAFKEVMRIQDAPALGDFRLKCEDPRVNPTSLELPLLKETKSLRHVEIWRVPLGKSPVSLVNLHSLALHRLPSVSSTDIKDLIKSNPGLKSFSVVYSTSGWPWGTIELPVLERLTLALSSGDFPMIIRIFKAPKLQHLYLTAPFDRLSAQYILETFPLANLRTLRLTSPNQPLFVGTVLHQVIEKCTSLAHLTLCDRSCNPQPIITCLRGILSLSPDGSSKLPHLSTLGLPSWVTSPALLLAFGEILKLKAWGSIVLYGERPGELELKDLKWRYRRLPPIEWKAYPSEMQPL
jgi:hypothetical protein